MTKSGKYCGKRRYCSFGAISSFVTMFLKSIPAEASESVYMRERVKTPSKRKGVQANYSPNTETLKQHRRIQNTSLLDRLVTHISR